MKSIKNNTNNYSLFLNIIKRLKVFTGYTVDVFYFFGFISWNKFNVQNKKK